MTTIGLLITLLGAGSIAANVMRLIDHIDQPAPPAVCGAAPGPG